MKGVLTKISAYLMLHLAAFILFLSKAAGVN